MHAGGRIESTGEPEDHLLAMRSAGAPSSTVVEHVLQLKHDELPPAAERFVRHYEVAQKVCCTIAMFGGYVCCNTCAVNDHTVPCRSGYLWSSSPSLRISGRMRRRHRRRM
jgi:hypothetical protein